MGSGSSNSVKTIHSDEYDDTDSLADRRNEEILIQPVEDGYPQPKPPRSKKSEVYKQEQYDRIDKKARETPIEEAFSWSRLIRYLSNGCQTDLELVRGLFVWLCVQNPENLPEKEEWEKDSPVEYIIKVFKRRSISLATFFARLCRCAQIPCVLIRGYGKSKQYEVGDGVDAVTKLHNVWNAVYVDENWRLVVPLWARQTTREHESQTSDTGESTLSLSTYTKNNNSEFEDFFFLTDPEELISFLWSSDPEWQLLESPWTIEKFCSYPNFHIDYFKHGFRLMTDYKSLLNSWNGRCEFILDTPEDYLVLHEVTLTNDEKDESHLQYFSNLDLNKYVIKAPVLNKWIFIIRFPVRGIYKVSLFGTKSCLGGPIIQRICDFVIKCEYIKDNIQPLPCDPGNIGFGPSSVATNAGLTSPSHVTGVVQINNRQFINVSFCIESHLYIRIELLSNQFRATLFKNYIIQNDNRGRLNIKVHIPFKAEYVLRFYVRKDKYSTERNVCNYLLTPDESLKQKRTKDLPVEIRARRHLKSVTESARKSEDFVEAIEKFIKLQLEDKGDLTKAIKRQKYLQIRQELRDAINRQRVDTLETAVTRASGSEFAGELKSLLTKARSVIETLRNQTMSHNDLRFEHKTFVEIMRYDNPELVIFHLIKTLMVILGEQLEYLKDWHDVRQSVRQFGELSLLSKMKTFKSSTLTQERVEYAQELLYPYNKESVRKCSVALVPLYQWCRSVCDNFKGSRRSFDESKEDSELISQQTEEENTN